MQSGNDTINRPRWGLESRAGSGTKALLRQHRGHPSRPPQEGLLSDETRHAPLDEAHSSRSGSHEISLQAHLRLTGVGSRRVRGWPQPGRTACNPGLCRLRPAPSPECFSPYTLLPCPDAWRGLIPGRHHRFVWGSAGPSPMCAPLGSEGAGEKRGDREGTGPAVIHQNLDWGLR